MLGYFPLAHTAYHLAQLPIQQPIEHKWVVRILLGKLEIGLGKDPIFKHSQPYAADTHSANNNIKILAQKLADPEWIRRREEKEKDKLSNSNQMMEFE